MKTLAQIQKAVQEARSKHDQAQGALKVAKEAMREKYGVTTKPEADAKRDELQADADAKRAAFDEALAAFAEEFPELAN